MKKELLKSEVIFKLGAFGDSVAVSIIDLNINYITVLSELPKSVRAIFNKPKVFQINCNCSILVDEEYFPCFKYTKIVSYK